MDILGTPVFDNATTVTLSESGAQGVIVLAMMRDFGTAQVLQDVTYGDVSGTEINSRQVVLGSWTWLLSWWFFDKADVDSRVGDTVAADWDSAPTRPGIAAYALDTVAVLPTVEAGDSGEAATAASLGPIAGAADSLLLSGIVIGTSGATKDSDGFTTIAAVSGEVLSNEFHHAAKLLTTDTSNQTNSWSFNSTDYAGSIIRIEPDPTVPTLDSFSGGDGFPSGETAAVAGGNLTNVTTATLDGVDVFSGFTATDASNATQETPSLTDAEQSGFPQYGSIDYTVTDGSASATLSVTHNPPSGKQDVDLAGTLNTDPEQSLIPHEPANPQVGWQLIGDTVAVRDDGGTDPALTLNADGSVNFTFESGVKYTFDFQFLDPSTNTLYSAGTATVVDGVIVSQDFIQGKQQAGFRSIGGTTGTYNEDAIAAFKTDLSNDAGTYNELKIRWLQQKMSSTTTNLPDLQAEAAADRGVSRWQEIDDVEDIGG